eukprot:SAG11_NODE_169_length_13635_cov_13.307993_4_plen_77_part_00
MPISSHCVLGLEKRRDQATLGGKPHSVDSFRHGLFQNQIHDCLHARLNFRLVAITEPPTMRMLAFRTCGSDGDIAR